jgi:hypothetical protein
MLNLKLRGATVVGLALLFSCEQSNVESLEPLDDSPVFVELPGGASARGRSGADGLYAVHMAEYITAAESGQVGRTVYFSNVGNKQLGADFVPELSLDGTSNVSWYVDELRPSNDLPVATTTTAIDRAMQTWEGVTCSDLGLYKVPYNPAISTGYISALLGYGGSFDYVADVVHAGWLPGNFFDLLAPQGSTFILGVTFTIIFTDENGNPADTNNDGKSDVAWREIYYNDAFLWQDGATYDVETIALHEAGHGLSQAHFGKAFADGGKGKLHFAPRAVMNAAYSGVQTQINATDNGGHCSIWGNWPNN